MKRWICGAIAGSALLFGAAANAACVGRDLFQDMPPETQAAIRAAAADVPYAEGTVWRAHKGDARMLIVGTYHFTDDRHAASLGPLADRVDGAARLLVEAGPEEQAQLQKRMLDDPAVMLDTTGPTLPERMSKDQWARLSAALADRGLPAIMSSRLRPWYASLTLSVSPCMIAELRGADETGEAGGLDQMLMDRATQKAVPIAALEPYDTVFKLFQDLSTDDEIDMLLASLPGAEHADDYTATAAQAFFDGRIWELWAFTRYDAYANSGLSRDEVDRQTAQMKERLMDQRNRAWIAPLTQAATQAAADGKEIVGAMGALHLPGENGVLRLLERDGWTIDKGL